MTHPPIPHIKLQCRQKYRYLRLNVYYAITELALGWFKSYLSGRTHLVKVGSTLLDLAALQYGVPLGSILGPILFSLYTNPISSIIHSHSSINYHSYADDTQLYITLSPANFSHSMQNLRNCLNDIQNFMFTNKLKLNSDKTEFTLIGSQKRTPPSLSYQSSGKSGLDNTKCQEPQSAV